MEKTKTDEHAVALLIVEVVKLSREVERLEIELRGAQSSSTFFYEENTKAEKQIRELKAEIERLKLGQQIATLGQSGEVLLS